MKKYLIHQYSIHRRNRYKIKVISINELKVKKEFNPVLGIYAVKRNNVFNKICFV